MGYLNLDLRKRWKSCSVCMVSLLLICAMFIRTLTFGNKEEIKTFMNTLNVKQKLTYENIISERKTIYYMGILLGFLCTGLFLLWSKFYKKRKLYTWINACFSVIIMSFVTYFYYMLSPKSDYMILHLRNNEQHEEWLNVYKTMQYDYHVSFVYGLLSVAVLSYL